MLVLALCLVKFVVKIEIIHCISRQMASRQLPTTVFYAAVDCYDDVDDVSLRDWDWLRW